MTCDAFIVKIIKRKSIAHLPQNRKSALHIGAQREPNKFVEFLREQTSAALGDGERLRR